MEFSIGADLLEPDYSKPTLEVYRDSVEAAILNFQSTDVLTYVTGDLDPSWIPRWNQPMLFRNPFRFGRSLPWRPAGKTTPTWSIDKKFNILNLNGFVVDSIHLVYFYNESIFGNALLNSDEERNALKQVWQRILKTIEESQLHIPFSASLLTAAATSFSFGLDEYTEPADESCLLHNFVAYLKFVLDKETYDKYIPSDLSKRSRQADGHAFGKPVWDFKYPESSFFITGNGFMGCTVSTVRRGDLVCVALGSTYPLVLRPDGNEFLIKGYAYVHGLMHGEQRNLETQSLRIR